MPDHYNLKQTNWFYIIWLVLTFVPESILARSVQDSTKFKIYPERIHYNLKLTGKLSDPAWKKAKPVYLKYEVQPNDNVPAPVKTEAKIIYNNNFLYIGFICFDPDAQKIRAHITDRDDNFNDDFVGLFLDPFDSNQHMYEFFVNPYGVQSDMMRTGNNEDPNFDALWYSKGSINKKGYTVVIALPFKSLHFPDKRVQNWSIQLLRNWPRSSRYQMTWTKINLNNPCISCQSGKLQDIKGVKNVNTVELLPYAMSYQQSSLNNADNPESGLNNHPIDGRIGGSISYAPTSTTTLNAVINPDFSQVETDATQISVNQAFALYYPEKRPFFMKGADMFNTPDQLFYSRMINHPLAAGKFRENDAHFNLAFLTAYDRDAPFIIPGLESSSLIQSKLHAYTNVLRTKYNFGTDSYIGGLFTTRNIDQAHNYVGSLDWQWHLTNNYYFSGQAAMTDTKELNDTTLFNENYKFGNSSYDAAFNGQQYDGTSLYAQFQRQAKYYGFALAYTSYSPTFQAQDGFINRTDMRQVEGDQNVSYYPNSSWLDNGNVDFHGAWRYDYAGQFYERWIHASWYNQFKDQISLSAGYLPVNDELYNGHFFRGVHRFDFELNSKTLNAFAFDAQLQIGQFIYRNDPPALGRGYTFSASGTIEPTPRLHLILDYNYSTLHSFDHSVKYFSGDIVRMTGRYNFSRRLLVRLITQYDSFNKEIQVYPLIYYKLNPFTIFYMGMTDYMDHFDQPNVYKQANREFFVKFQYLIRS